MVFEYFLSNVTHVLQLITIMVGQNDLCRLTCKTNSSGNKRKSSGIQSAKKFARNVKRAVDKLYKNVPKAVVNIILPPGKDSISLSIVYPIYYA